MILKLSPFLFILISLCSEAQVHASPVLLWSNFELPKLPVPLSTIPSIHFISNYICTVKNKEIQLYVFSVNDLTIEDIEQSSVQNHPVLLAAKKEKTKFRYYRSVADDIYTATSLLPQSNNLQCASIHFEVKSIDNYETLQNALDNMQEKIDDMTTNQNSDALFVLLSYPVHNNILSRKRREANNVKATVITSNDTTCMFYAKQLYWNNGNGTSMGRPYNLSLPDSSCEPVTSSTGNETSVILKLTWKNEIIPDIINMSLTASIINRYWVLQNATLNGKEYRYFAYGMHDQMETPPTYSYACKTATFVRYDSSVPKQEHYNFSTKFYIIDLQFQPFHGNGLSFGAPNYCTSFFTRGIWMAITSSLLCLVILIMASYCLMSIKSNDRFDDPKGKPLMIKAQE